MWRILRGRDDEGIDAYVFAKAYFNEQLAVKAVADDSLLSQLFVKVWGFGDGLDDRLAAERAWMPALRRI